MEIEFTGKIWYWRGPSPWHFVTVPEQQSSDLKAISGLVTYGWGMIPVRVEIGEARWKTSLWPRDGHCIVPIKASVREAERIDEGDEVTMTFAEHVSRALLSRYPNHRSCEIVASRSSLPWTGL